MKKNSVEAAKIKQGETAVPRFSLFLPIIPYFSLLFPISPYKRACLCYSIFVLRSSDSGGFSSQSIYHPYHTSV